MHYVFEVIFCISIVLIIIGVYDCKVASELKNWYYDILNNKK